MARGLHEWKSGPWLSMDEHDDDLESAVHEGAEKETDSFPETSEDFAAQTDDHDTADDDEELHLDDDETEL